MTFLSESGEQEVMRNKRIRGYIIRALSKGYRGTLSVRQIVHMLITDELLLTPDVGKYLKYLEDGGYIRFTDKNANAYTAYEKDETIQLTKRGVDLVEDTIQDAGVDV